MINIIIDCKDQLYRQGVEFMLANILRITSREQLNFSDKLDSHVIEKADIIVKYFSAGESCICQPVFLYRKKHSLLIGFYDGARSPNSAMLPLCFKDIIFINRNDPLNEVIKAIQRGWENRYFDNNYLANHNCQGCRHRTLSLQQEKVASYIYAGIDTKQIAQHLKINAKTVCAHKRMIMLKFNLKNDSELISFLRLLSKNETTPGSFHESPHALYKLRHIDDSLIRSIA